MQRSQRIQIHARRRTGPVRRSVQIIHHCRGAAEIGVGEVHAARDQAGAAGDARGGEAGGGILDGDGRRRGDAKAREGDLVHLRVGLLARGILGADPRGEALRPVGAEQVREQGIEIGAAGGGGHGHAHALGCAFVQQPAHAGARRDAALRYQRAELGVLALVDGARQRFAFGRDQRRIRLPRQKGSRRS